ncbi:MAG TPA: inorganic diphosphatase [Terracidiphilus sp.]|nr:inorganic diphosphatase [Terracidiphilus sp.]
MDSYLELPIGDGAPEIVTAVVEIPQDSVNKYEYDSNLNVFVLDRVLHSQVHFPGDYGFITQTIAQGGDPLDIPILADTHVFPGCMYNARPIGLFEMLNHGSCDEKIVAYATANSRMTNMQNYTEVQPHVLLEVEHFFSVYNDLEGKETKVLGWKDRKAACAMIRSSHERFLKQHVSK